MYSKAILSTIAFAVLTTAAPAIETRQTGSLGVYMCPKAGFLPGDNGEACRWKSTSDQPAGTCKHLHWFGMPATAERHISFAPDKGNSCVIYRDLNCDISKGAILVPGPIDDMYVTQPSTVDTQFLSYMCSTAAGGVNAVAAQAVTHVE